MINHLTWNMRGLWKKGKIPFLNKLILDNQLELVIILEVKNDLAKIVELDRAINKKHYFKVLL